MAAPIRIVGGISRPTAPTHPRGGKRVRPLPRLGVTVGKSDTIRDIELTEADLLRLAGDAIRELQIMQGEREKESSGGVLSEGDAGRRSPRGGGSPRRGEVGPDPAAGRGGAA